MTGPDGGSDVVAYGVKIEGIIMGCIYLGFVDVDWIRLCIFSDQCAR